MNDLLSLLGKLATELHPNRIEAIAESIRAIDTVHNLERTRQVFGPNIDDNVFTKLQTVWSNSPQVSPQEVSAALLAASKTATILSSNATPEIVWTGPKTSFIPTRNTEQVILEVIKSAKSKLFLVAYVFYKATAITDALLEAISHGIKVTILLESSIEHGGAVRGDSVKAIAESVDGADIYVWDPKSRDPERTGMSAVVHAKCVVADSTLAFITSANLTSAALERNMELGVLLRGGTAPESLMSHLKALITTREISRWN